MPPGPACARADMKVTFRISGKRSTLGRRGSGSRPGPRRCGEIAWSRRQRRRNVQTSALKRSAFCVDSRSTVHSTPMAESEHDKRLTFPLYIDDDSVITDSEFVGLHGTEPRKKPLRIFRQRFELPSDSVLQTLLKLAVLPCCDLREFDPERQEFIPLPSGAPMKPFCPLGPGDAPRKSLQSSRC